VVTLSVACMLHKGKTSGRSELHRRL